MTRPGRGSPRALVAGEVAVQVPATSANLGPGFDALGLALALHDVVAAEIDPAGAAGEVAVTVVGEGADEVPLDGSHLVHRSMVRGFAALGVPAPPAVRLRCENRIPHGRGLGSSSAAIVAGLSLARALVEDGEARMEDDMLLALAAVIEGHPDNVAPAVHGGLTVAWSEAGASHAVRLDVTARVSFLAFVPPHAVSTSVARGLLPSSVPHRDAATNAGRAALLVAALTAAPSGLPDVLLAATADTLHQSYRAAAMPGSAELVTSLRGEGVAAVVSGAGPTVLALVPPERVPTVAARVPDGWQVHDLEAEPHGVRLLR